MTALLASSGGDGFESPSVREFFPKAVLFDGTIFELNRVRIIALVMTVLLGGFFVLAFRRPKIVPTGLQNVGEVALDFVRFQIVDEVMGERGRRFIPYITALFWTILAFNVAGIIPFLQISPNSVVALPLIFALCTYVIFNYAGVKAQGAGPYLKSNLFPPGIPKPLYLLITPIEFVSTFLLRPFTLTVRLLANMMSGHLLLVLFFTGASYLLLEADTMLKPFGLLSAAMGFAFTLFEVLVAVLQAYIFALLTAVYLDGALSAEH